MVSSFHMYIFESRFMFSFPKACSHVSYHQHPLKIKTICNGLSGVHEVRLFPSLGSEIQGCIFQADCTHFLLGLHNEVTIFHFHISTFTIHPTSELSNVANSSYSTAHLISYCHHVVCLKPDHLAYVSNPFCNLTTVKP